MKYPLIFLFIISIALWGCNTGYTRQNGQWVWATHDEYNGRRSIPIPGIDNKSFRVLDHENFGADKFSVYYKGRKINKANPEEFIILTKNDQGYAKDGNHVFLDTEVILKADPKTFEVLEFPYGRDKKDVYNGTLPMQLENAEVESFTVTNEDKMMAGSKSTMLVDYFIEFSPEYSWIKAYDPELKHVIMGSSGTGKTSKRKFKGLKEIK